MVYNTVMSLVLLVPLIALAGEASAIVSSPVLFSASFWCVMIITGIFGFLINLAMFMQIKFTSPLTNTISGTVKVLLQQITELKFQACLQTVLAVIIWHSEVSLLVCSLFLCTSKLEQGALGILLVIGGSAWYSVVRYREMPKRSDVLPTHQPIKQETPK